MAGLRESLQQPLRDQNKEQKGHATELSEYRGFLYQRRIKHESLELLECAVLHDELAPGGVRIRGAQEEAWPPRPKEGLPGTVRPFPSGCTRPSRSVQCHAKRRCGPQRSGCGWRSLPNPLAAARGYTKIVEALIAAGANQYAQDGSNRTPATLASEAEQPGVRNLLQYGPPKPDTKQVYDGMDGPSLHVALNQPAMLKHYLLAGGVADVYDRDNDRTPLHWAAARGAVRCAELLLASGAELDRKDALGRTPKALAYDFNQRELYDFLAQAEGPEKRPSSIFA